MILTTAKRILLITIPCLMVLGGCVLFPPPAKKNEAVPQDEIPAKTADESPKTFSNDGSESSYYYFIEAQLQRNSGNMDKAAEYLKKAIAANKTSEFLKLELAAILMHQSKEKEALAVLEEILAENPNSMEAMILFGRLKQKGKDIATAKKAYERIIAEAPDHEDIYMILGSIYMEEADYINAIRVYRQLVDRFPGAYAGHFFMGKAFLIQKAYEHAETHLRKAIEIEPRLEEARFELIKLYKDQKRTDDIIAVYEDILKGNQDNIRANLELAMFYMEGGDNHKASVLLKKLGKQSGSDPEIVSIIFKRHLEKAEFDTVIKITAEMLAGNPASSMLHYIIGVAFEGKKEIPMALEHFQKVQTDSRFFENAVIRRAFIHQESEEINTAIEVLKDAIRVRPKSPEFRLYLGTFYEDLEDWESAVSELKTGLKTAPEHVNLHFRLGVVYDKSGDKEASILEMQRVIELDPKHANALNYLGYTWTDMGRNLDQAEVYIKRAMELKPGDGYITDSLGWVYFKKGLFRDALTWLIKAANLVPDDPIILEHVGDAYLKLGMTEKALESYRRAMQEKKEDKTNLEKKIRSLLEKRIPE